MTNRNPAKPCPICDKPAQSLHDPFCSKRCKDIDLNRWLSDSYIIPGNPAEDDSESVPNADFVEGEGDFSPSVKTRH